MTDMTMTDDRVKRARAKRLRYWGLVGASLALLLGDGLFLWSRGHLPRDFSQIPHDMALGMAAGYGLGAIIGIVFLCRNMLDEHERSARSFGMVIALSALLLLYPLWAMLAQAQVLPPVSAFALWAGAMLLYLAGYGWRKYR